MKLYLLPRSKTVLAEGFKAVETLYPKTKKPTKINKDKTLPISQVKYLLQKQG